MSKEGGVDLEPEIWFPATIPLGPWARYSCRQRTQVLRSEELTPSPAPEASPPDCANAKEGQKTPSPRGGAEADVLSIALAGPIRNDVPPVPSQREDPINVESVGPTYRSSLLRP